MPPQEQRWIAQIIELGPTQFSFRLKLQNTEPSSSTNHQQITRRSWHHINVVNDTVTRFGLNSHWCLDRKSGDIEDIEFSIPADGHNLPLVENKVCNFSSVREIGTDSEPFLIPGPGNSQVLVKWSVADDSDETVSSRVLGWQDNFLVGGSYFRERRKWRKLELGSCEGVEDIDLCRPEWTSQHEPAISGSYAVILFDLEGTRDVEELIVCEAEEREYVIAAACQHQPRKTRRKVERASGSRSPRRADCTEPEVVRSR